VPGRRKLGGYGAGAGVEKRGSIAGRLRLLATQKGEFRGSKWSLKWCAISVKGLLKWLRFGVKCSLRWLQKFKGLTFFAARIGGLAANKVRPAPDCAQVSVPNMSDWILACAPNCIPCENARNIRGQKQPYDVKQIRGLAFREGSFYAAHSDSPSDGLSCALPIQDACPCCGWRAYWHCGPFT
jgi:hypothetical protein